jgi:hypothetical protein
LKTENVSLEKGKQGPSEWLDLRRFPTDRTLYLASEDQRADDSGHGLVRLEISPDKKLVVPLDGVYPNERAARVTTDYDYAFVRIARVKNGPQEGLSYAWSLVAQAADEMTVDEGRGDAFAPAAAKAPEAANDHQQQRSSSAVEARLERLAELRTRGLISDQDCAARTSKILEEI